MADFPTPKQQATSAKLTSDQQMARKKAVDGKPEPEGAVEAGAAGGGRIGRAQEFAMQKAKAQLLGAKTQKEAELRKAQIERIMKTAKNVKKIIKIASAAAGSEVILPIIYLYLSYFKDYLLGNLLNGDPTGHFAKKKSFVGVTPLSFPEVLLFLAITGGMFVNFLVTCWPLIVVAAIIFAVATGEVGYIFDLMKFLGGGLVNPILNYFGLPSVPGI